MIFVRAPLRIPLGGGGTDLPSYYSQHGGFILSAAINKYVYIYVNRPSVDDLLRIKYAQIEEVSHVDDIQHDLVRPALKVLHLKSHLEIVSMADLPSGTGMGSSGSYLVALLKALYELKDEKILVQALAEQACHIEMNLAGHPVGKQDHYLAAFGGISCLDIEKNGFVHVSPLDISISTIEDLRNGLLLFYTGITRRSRDILAEQKQDTEANQTIVINSLHRTKVLGYQIREVLEKGDLEQFGRYLDQHWQNKKQRSHKISQPEIDRWYQLALKSGAIGGKLMGAGGGGFFMFLCLSRRSKANVRQALSNEGLREMSFDFDFEGAKVMLNT